ncbi:MAG: fasciclin domain-containing protein, partial [Oxalobacteraceae bacterium]|nr:fasciclin domain-containing protein [Oxalobacteraceae bacterium]
GGFKMFLASVKAAGMTDSLRHQGPFTVFAPSDEAFAKLPEGEVESLMKDKAKLARMLSRHIVPGKLLVAEVKPGPVKTIQGDSIKLTSDNGMITVDGARVTQSDLKADNGVIQVIDKVILP